MKDFSQQQIDFNGDIFGNKCWIYCVTLIILWADLDNKLMIFFLFFLENRIWHLANCLPRRQYAWAVKSYFLEKNNIYIVWIVICWNFYPACNTGTMRSLDNVFLKTGSPSRHQAEEQRLKAVFLLIMGGNIVDQKQSKVYLIHFKNTSPTLDRLANYLFSE